MKKVILTLVAFLMVVLPAFSESVSVQTARRAAQSFLNSKTEGNPQIHLIGFAEKSSFSNFYVFGNDRCFVIIAADDCVHPVLGYSTESGFGTGIMPDCISDWLKAYNKGIAAAKESRVDATAEISSEWERLLNGSSLEPKSKSFIKPLIRTKWSQSAPFNNLCPPDTANHATGHAVAGCGAIAMAQIMNYWEHPVRGIGSHSYNHSTYGTLFANFGETIYDWDNMKNLYTRGYSDAEALAVATLVYHCGVSINMRYGPSSSNAGEPILDSAMRYYFDYSSSTNYVFKSQYSNTQWISMLKNDLDNLQPVLYRAASNNQGANAHIFICDGYDENEFFHFEWGRLGGEYDGYYTIADLHQGSTNYTYGNAAMFGCHPNETSINPPSNVVTTVNGRTVNISWSPVYSSAFYKVYRDGELIVSNLTSTSFVDVNACYGSHSYYVKSVKSDGTMSLRSDISVVDLHFQGPLPNNLQATVNSYDVSLSWQPQNPRDALLQYGTGSYANCFPLDNSSGTYWAQRYPASILSNHAGMAVNKVSVFFKYAGNYQLQLYLGDECRPEVLLYQRNYDASAESWQDINIDSPVFIDYTQDLWIVMYGNSTIDHPATYCNYSGSGVENSACYSFSGNNWVNLAGNYRSWMMKTYLTDGTYTYNLYRNGDAVATNLSNSIYTDSNLPDGFYDYHVTTSYFGGESDPSNTVTVMVGNPTYTVNVSASPNNGGLVTGGGTYNYNQSCAVTATPNTGYTFVNWTENGNVVSSNACYTFTVTADRNLVAHFQLQSFTITATADPSNGGTVTGDGTYNYGQTCTVTATPANGYQFQNWTENGTVVFTNANYSFTVNTDRTLVANFSLDNFIVTVSAEPSNGGSVTGGGAFHYGDNCSVIATPNPGFNFVNWTENGVQVSNETPYSFTVTCDRNLVAHFSSQSYVITAIADPENGGTVTGAGGYNYGETCHLVATANPGFDFLNWTKNGTVVSSNPDYSFTVTESATYIAHFSAQTYTVTVAADPNEGGNVSGGGSFNYGQICTVHALANGCYRFVNWTENGSIISGQRDYSFTVTSNRNLIANFSRETCEITAEVNPIGGGVVIGSGLYLCGETVRLIAEPNENFTFLHWTENDNIITTDSIVQFIATGARHLVANFVYYDGMDENVMPVEIYPNPVDDILIIRGEGIYKVTVFNMAGQSIDNADADAVETLILNVNDYEAGVYLLLVQSEYGSSRKVFVKK
jgi:hypothetical protein